MAMLDGNISVRQVCSVAEPSRSDSEGSTLEDFPTDSRTKVGRSLVDASTREVSSANAMDGLLPVDVDRLAFTSSSGRVCIAGLPLSALLVYDLDFSCVMGAIGISHSSCSSGKANQNTVPLGICAQT